MQKCDIIAILHDNTQKSLFYLEDILSFLPRFVPKIIVNAKSDQINQVHLHGHQVSCVCLV